MRNRRIICRLAPTLFLLLLALPGCSLGIDRTRKAERLAIPTAEHPLAGFWKHQAKNDYGLAIAPAGQGLYSISFCGPGSCFAPGTYRPNSNIKDDETYRIVDADTIEIKGKAGYSRYHRFESRTSSDTPNRVPAGS